jgi:hypothetical protein
VESDRQVALFSVALVCALGSAISTLEWLANRRQLRPGGLFGWEIVGSTPLAVGRRLRARLLKRLLVYRSYVVVLLLRLAAVILLPFAIWTQDRAIILTVVGVVLLATLLMNVRSIYGMDGSDQMTTQIYGALFLGYAAGTTLGLEVALWYIAAQACLSYFTSGFAKAVSPQWRRGDNVFRIFNTRTYGFEPVARVLHGRPHLVRVLDWSAFTVEMAFPIGLLVGYPAVLVFVAWGIGFHLMNAVIMGLNSFFWAFVATYPAVIYVSMVAGG